MIKFENKVNERFYYIEIQKDLLNDLVLFVTYGGKYISRCRVICCDSREKINEEIERLTQRRLKRGYEIVT